MAVSMDIIKRVVIEGSSQGLDKQADALEVERDQLSTELRETYQALVTEIVDVFARVDANTAVIGELHARAPDGERRRLTEAELVARDLERYDAANRSARAAAGCFQLQPRRMPGTAPGL